MTVTIHAGELSKGMSGKVATIGGCREYTGAPYFASITCLRVSITFAETQHVQLEPAHGSFPE